MLPLFGITLLKEEADFLWYDMPGKGRSSVQKSSPRIWFESTADAHQAGARGILLTKSEEAAAAVEMTAADLAADCQGIEIEDSAGPSAD